MKNMCQHPVKPYISNPVFFLHHLFIPPRSIFFLMAFVGRLTTHHSIIIVTFFNKYCLQKHPNLVKFIEDVEYNEKPCLVFEFLQMDLMEFTGRHYTCRANLAIRTIAQQVCIITLWFLPPNP